MCTIKFVLDQLNTYGNFRSVSEAEIWLLQNGWVRKHYAFEKNEVSVQVVPVLTRHDVDLLEKGMPVVRKLKGIIT